MDLKKLPPSMLVLLGLGCPGVQACLSPPVDSAEASSSGVDTGSLDHTSGPPQDSSAGEEVGPCLSPPEETFGTDTSTSTSTGTSTGSDTGFGTSSGSDSGSSSGSGTDSAGEGSTTFVPCLAPPGIAPDDDPDAFEAPPSSTRVAMSRREALEWVLDALPPDVAARLHKTIP